MAVMIPLATTARHTDWPLTGSEPETVLPNLQDWRPEQLWLSDQCWSQTAQQRMTMAVTAATDAVLKTTDVPLPQLELLTVFRYTRRHAAALRLKARILRGPRVRATPTGRDLAAAALWLAAVQHDDLLAAVEFAAEAAGRAAFLETEPETGDLVLPPGVATVRQSASRMRRRGREVLAHRLSWPDLDTVGHCLEQALAEDPLRTPRGAFDWGHA